MSKHHLYPHVRVIPRETGFLDHLYPHDRTIFREAEALKKLGWNVRADHIPVHETPKSISRRVPDIVATKRGGKRIVEVKTEQSFKPDSDQIKTFRRSAGQQKNARFYVRIVDKEGTRVTSSGRPPGEILSESYWPRRKGIINEAKALRRLGWNVRANVKGTQYDKPKKLGRDPQRRPDIHATKSGHTRIAEIMTDPGRKSRHETFRQHAGQKNNTIFYWRVVDALGRRRRDQSDGITTVPDDVF